MKFQNAFLDAVANSFCIPMKSDYHLWNVTSAFLVWHWTVCTCTL